MKSENKNVKYINSIGRRIGDKKYLVDFLENEKGFKATFKETPEIIPSVRTSIMTNLFEKEPIKAAASLIWLDEVEEEIKEEVKVKTSG